jgi:PadR family transcriptional regulator PadR
MAKPVELPLELPQGTLEMLILKAVSLGPLHGYGILLRIQQISGERLEILQGSFYTAIYRLEPRGWIKGAWGSRRTTAAPAFIRSPLPGRVNSRPRPPNGLTWPLWSPLF